jgi:hypothetical protein
MGISCIFAFVAQEFEDNTLCDRAQHIAWLP